MAKNERLLTKEEARIMEAASEGKMLNPEQINALIGFLEQSAEGFEVQRQEKDELTIKNLKPVRVRRAI